MGTALAGCPRPVAPRDLALRRSEAFLLEAQRLSSTGSFSWRVPFDEICWSEQLSRILELECGERPSFDAIDSRVHPEDLEAVRQMRERARSDGSDIECEFRLLMPGHRVKYVHMVAHGTREMDGSLEYIGAIQDVTQRRMAEEALSRARSELVHVTRVMVLGALTASIAHEVNQPLTGIVTNASTCLRMLAANPPNVEGARETARRTLRDANRAADVISRLRELFARKEPQSIPFDLNDAACEVIALLHTELQRNSVVVRTQLAQGLPAILGDRVQLQQVVLNLLMNAAEAMAADADRARLAIVRTECCSDELVRLSVTDTGPGLEAQVMARLFEPFYSTKAGGMGIGLFVSRSIIERHHGSIQVESNEGGGVTFSFSVPRMPVAAPIPWCNRQGCPDLLQLPDPGNVAPTCLPQN